jgi:biopolymer transport protein ExbB/TolQ
VDHPNRFLLLNRILVALSNLRNIGRIGDVDEILRSQAEREESMMESSYSLLRGFIWAVPVLGFIGTVLGLSGAIGNFGAVLGQAGDFDAITKGLKDITSDLATAFETTLVALVAALLLQMILTFLKKSEEDFLDDCSEYCLRNVVNRLRILEHGDG